MRGRLSQGALARALGYSQPSVHQWVSGASLPKIVDIPRIEDACGRPRGFILHLAGLVAPVRTVEEALAMDPTLDDAGRSVVLGAYHGVVDHYRLIGDAPDPGEG
jgi:hypothetical protein